MSVIGRYLTCNGQSLLCFRCVNLQCTGYGPWVKYERPDQVGMPDIFELKETDLVLVTYSAYILKY
jgi:hypothetical protein